MISITWIQPYCCLIFFLLQTQTNPLKDTADDYLANASSFAMCVIFVCCIIFKISTLTELRDVHTRMSIELQDDFRVPTDVLTMILFLSVFSAITLSFVFLLGQLAIERARHARDIRASLARRLRHRNTHDEVLAPTLEDERNYHIFLSHVWGTGQDQMRIVKQRLLEMMPDLRVFLDVDGSRALSLIDRASLDPSAREERRPQPNHSHIHVCPPLLREPQISRRLATLSATSGAPPWCSCTAPMATSPQRTACVSSLPLFRWASPLSRSPIQMLAAAG